MSESNEGLLAGTESDDGNLLDAFLAEGDLDDAGLVEAAPEPAQEAQEGSEDTATEAKDEDDTELDAEGADKAEAAEDEGDYLEFETEDGETQRVSAEEALAAHQQLKEFGSNVDQIRNQVIEQAAGQVKSRMTELDTTINEAAQAYGLLRELIPNVQDPDPVLLDQNSPYYNPQAFREQQAAVEQVRQVMGEAEGGLQKAVEARQKQAEADRQSDMTVHWTKLVSADPSWGKGDAAKRLDTLRQDVAGQYGLSAEEVAGIYHNGFIRMAEDAVKYRQAQSKQLTPKAKQPPRLVRAAGKRKAADGMSARRAKANQQLKKTGQVSDLEGAWGEFLE